MSFSGKRTVASRQRALAGATNPHVVILLQYHTHNLVFWITARPIPGQAPIWTVSRDQWLDARLVQSRYYRRMVECFGAWMEPREGGSMLML